MSIRTRSVSSVLARMGMRSADKRGIGPEEFQRLTGISELDVAQPDGRICADRHVAMLNLVEPAWSATNPLENAPQVPVGGPIGTLFATVTNAPDLATAFDKFLQYRALLGDVDAFSIRRQGSAFELDYLLEGQGRTPVSAYGNLSFMAGLARQYGGSGTTIAAIELTGKAFAPLGPLQEMVGCKVRFGQAHNRMLLDAPLADQPYERHNDITYRITASQADAALGKLYRRPSFTAQIEHQITALFRERFESGMGGSVLEQVCDRLLMSRFVLHRRLQKEGANFQGVLSRVRMREAQRLLRQPDVQIADISDLLGFSSPGVFSRFFSSQTGSSPSRYRSANPPG